ncbi:aminoglycoside phosphotransferase family protein [Streptomyces sp. Je 1-369]|uniref:aminoglycoside phosphotransferase family protein n=1 Tax=Streptomyces sp. Je 1-369 TaxID=2966192 RepID=UPI00228542B1|nr:aminoglycoside phosphotransferase family protein [Streptomyces sp. Je 1-369]WAL99792.1 aminoglycoside phosphotransferase family protein [Streptomyces sp. Je 1-369]
MREESIEVSPVVRRRAELLGTAGEEWLAGLPALIADLEHRWSVTVGPPFRAGAGGYVARARAEDGTDAVLKLALPEPGSAGQITTLLRSGGRGYVRVLDHDADRFALLMEQLGTPLSELAFPPERRIAVLCATLRRAWQVPRSPELLVEAAEGGKARGLAVLVERLWRDLGRPCSIAAYDRAMTYAERRAAAHCPSRAVVVHGDPHPGNLLRLPAAGAPRAGAESGFAFVDPDGFLADPAYDLGVVLRDWCAELLSGDAPRLARRYCALIAEASGTDATAVWEWGYLERVSTALYLLAHGAEGPSRPFFDTAEILADTNP